MASLPRRCPAPSPSPALLALLAAITAAPATANPLPSPDFLCPSLIPCSTPSSTPTPTLTPTPTPTTSTTTTTTFPHRRHARRSIVSDTAIISHFPDKYERSDDGLWYLASTWSLHGKTKGHSHPAIPIFSATPTPPSPNNDVAVDPTTTTPDITDTLPTGWKVTQYRTKFYSIPIIVVFSLSLAIGISLILAGAMYFHKRRKSKPQPKDLSPTLDASHDDLRDDAVRRALRRAEKGVARKDRMWVCWRREARAGLRRRRRFQSDTRETDDAPSPGDSLPSSSLRAPSPSPSRVPSPPAYRRASTPGVAPPPCPPTPAPDPAPAADADGDTPRIAHVATDDKAVLARLHLSASAPSPSSITPTPTPTHPHAPEWEDERIEDFHDDELAPGPSAPPRFPPPPQPPPSEVDNVYPTLALPYYGQQPDVALRPSAPPEEGEDEGGAGVVPSAPPAEEDVDVEIEMGVEGLWPLTSECDPGPSTRRGNGPLPLPSYSP